MKDKPTIKRTRQKATPEQTRENKELRQLIDQDKPEILRQGRILKKMYQDKAAQFEQIVKLLKAERLRQGLSLAEFEKRSLIGKAALSRLENDKDSNPTMETLQRYAHALGKRMLVVIDDE